MARHFFSYLHRTSKQPVTQDITPTSNLFNTLISEPNNIPTPGECAVHLELLEVFHTLRTRIIYSKELDRVFGLHPSRLRIPGRRSASQGTEKWHRFVSLAVDRFQHWIRAAETLLEQDGNNETHILPPVDILMVWHAFLLNPLDYKNFCTSHQLHRIQETPFPWSAIHTSINPTTWSYDLPNPNSQWLESEANLPTDLLYSLTHPAQPPPNHPTETESLLQNVLRQTTFIDHMHAHLWIRSPDIEDLLDDARESYNGFVELFRLYPGVILVPTLAIDLVWHTHLCSAERYTACMMERVGRFVDHDDKLGKGTLDDGFERTKVLFEREFGGRGGSNVMEEEEEGV
ncbi:hypothetical protein BO94DRAFT_6880 [Aspergillus sclerotioniger CBS 115572]|uniref:Uncharacterized protein n=1 Tax=Aspergillus sclerotioniger CBS 115572 TaxID=1450535 RepID=A0A317XCK4_9EURO|nr:hypothetical protein BO94DRAFT_6880 [Aspergillus sclerotioniger CBS 115572]PWY96346.1 hypothetical protein BO94DRAFT_6880 [Aspergillus sclerotioniger CBS 115572]